MNNNENKATELIERYVYAVTRRLPHSMRDDIDRELHTIIDDMLEARCGERQPDEHDAEAVLSDLGKPSELAAKYDPNGEKVLISSKYYPTYLTVLKICMICVFASLALSAVLSIILDPSVITPEKYTVGGFVSFLTGLFGKTLGGIVTAFVSCFGGVTLVFAILERNNVSAGIFGSDELAKLPSVPSKNVTVKRSECIAGIVFNTIFLLLFCFVPQFMGVYGTNTGEYVPIFNAELIKSLWPLWLVFFALGTSGELCQLIVGCYNKTVLFVELATNLLSLFVAGFALLRSNIMNPLFSAQVTELLAAEGETSPELITSVFSSFNVFMFACIAFALLLDSLDVAVKTYKFYHQK